jgi:hypothetical protein
MARHLGALHSENSIRRKYMRSRNLLQLGRERSLSGRRQMSMERNAHTRECSNKKRRSQAKLKRSFDDCQYDMLQLPRKRTQSSGLP